MKESNQNFKVVADETFRLLIDAVTDYAIFVMDKNGNILTWNKGAQRLKGYTADEIIGKNFSLFYRQKDLASKHPEHELNIAYKTGRYEEEGWRVKKNGSLFWASVTIIKIFDNKNNFIGFAKITRDLSEKKEAEENLRQSEERFRFLVNNIEDYAILTLDLEGRVLTWNTGAEKIKGFKAQEIIGKHISRFYTPEDIESDKPKRELETVVGHGRFEDEGWRVRKDGVRYWANVIISSLRDRTGKMVGFSMITRDLTERKNAEEKLKQINISLEEKVAVRTRDLESAVKGRDQFLSIASHELNTPLTSLKLQTQMRLKKFEKGAFPTTDEAIKKMLNDDLKQINRLIRLVDDILEISRMNAGKLVLKKTECNLNEIVDDIALRFSGQFEINNNAVDVVLSTDKIIGHWDCFRVDQIISNLVANAIKYGAGTPIFIVVKRDEKNGIVEVIDHGIGIDENDQERIFGQFERAISATEISGMGLGLFISKQLVESLGGSIKVHSKLGEGAKFTVTLPLNG